METVTSSFKVTKTKHSKLPEVDFNRLEFGNHFSDHMLIADCLDGKWSEFEIVPFANLSISPATVALQYGQSVFEGMKAFRMEDGSINIFRIDKHYERFNRSLARMCMPQIPYEIFQEGMMQLVVLDKNWVPDSNAGALYIRPFMFASDSILGVRPSSAYRFIILTGPAGSLFSKPIKVKVETDYIRAAKGGTGSTKCAGNYGGSLYPTKLAKDRGYDNVIWTDAKEHKYVEESGVMNLMFVLDGKLVTPPLSDTILDGVTRDALLTIARYIGITVEERPVSIDEIKKAFKVNAITEAFGVGTAAVVAPIDTIGIEDMDYKLPAYNDANVMFQLKKQLEAIRFGTAPDIYNWNFTCS
jgi:branched-chain amino acid aminotransferase